MRTGRGQASRRASASSALWGRATARSPATCSPISTGQAPRIGSAAPSATARRRHPFPERRRPRPPTFPPATYPSGYSPDLHHRPEEVTVSTTITPELVSLDVGLGADKAAVIKALAARVVAQGRATDADALFADAWAREQKDETGLPGGIAIPHAKSAAVTVPSLAFARLKPGVDFGASDGPADLVFLIAAPEGAAEAHLAVLSKLARSLMQSDFTAGLRAASDSDEVVEIVRAAIGEGDASAPRAAAPVTPAAAVPAAGGLTVDGRPARIVAVTS